MPRIKSNGTYLGRTTELGTVTYYFSDTNLYEITCNCGITFTAKTAKAKESSLACKFCHSAMMRSYGKKGNAITNNKGSK